MIQKDQNVNNKILRQSIYEINNYDPQEAIWWHSAVVIDVKKAHKQGTVKFKNL